MYRAAIVLAALVAVSGPALADTREDVLSGIARCGAIADDHAWLNCLYGAAQPMRGHLGLPPAAAAQTALVPPASAEAPRGLAASVQPSVQPKESDGFFSRMLGGQPVISGVKVTDYWFSPQGFFTVTLANGQMWEQRDGPLARWRGPAAQYSASISKGAVGSFNLTVAGDKGDAYAQYKVVRLH